MKKYLQTTTNTEYTDRQLRKLAMAEGIVSGLPEEWLAAGNYEEMGPPVPPNHDPDTQAIQLVEPAEYEKTEGLWHRKYEVRALTTQELNARIVSQIQSLEAQQTARRIREAALGDEGSITFLQGLDDQITVLRAQIITE